MTRTSEIIRKTRETDISIKLTLEGNRKVFIDSGCGFLNHMLELFAFHGCFDLTLSCKGDTQIDDHHTVEDVGISLGQAFLKALGEMRGIARYGSFLLPMDEALVACAVDLSGRPYVVCKLDPGAEKIGTFDVQLVKEFFLGFSRGLNCTIHLHQIAGENAHHIVEAAFKGFGRAMKQACTQDPAQADFIPSSKGMLV